MSWSQYGPRLTAIVIYLLVAQLGAQKTGVAADGRGAKARLDPVSSEFG